MCLPPALTLGATVAEHAFTGHARLPGGSYLGGLAIHVGLAMLLATWIGATHRLSMPTRIAWVIASGLGGLGGPLAMIAIYRQPVCEPCPQCGQQRRVDKDLCEECGSEWTPPANDGNEIFQRQASEADAALAGPLSTSS